MWEVGGAGRPANSTLVRGTARLPRVEERRQLLSYDQRHWKLVGTSPQGTMGPHRMKELVDDPLDTLESN